ncbi:hypothetical protein TrST_g1836 [Triparma strigata]|uniref:Serine aminopeptidase S33 domain-containing protein n=1 Tax=Triparma strigata TaxID=1606541 RepID=A0A9W7BJB1_9STRA|nr:hypothetical protein TrST_g1836 [Triparma strigata]
MSAVKDNDASLSPISSAGISLDIEDGRPKSVTLTGFDPPAKKKNCLCCRCLIPPCHWVAFLLWWGLMTALLNLLCEANPVSPFWPIALSLNTYGTFSCIVLFTLLLFCVYKRERLNAFRENRSALMSAEEAKLNLKKAGLFLVVYFLLTLPLHFFSKTMIYPGIAFKLWAETTPDEPDLYGQAFTFKSSFDDKELHGYHTFRSVSAFTPTNPSGGVEVLPVIMFGGNGGSGWENVFTDVWLRDDTKVYDIYSFSYRGYEPNDSFGLPSEKNILADSYSFFEFVQAKYPDNRIIVTSHSLGTGVASAVSSHFSSDDIACTVLGMPFSTMSQCSQEVAYYTPMIFLWAVDAWPSTSRVAEMDSSIPLAILSAGQDELIAPHHQVKMEKAAASDNVLFLYDHDASHNAISQTLYSDIANYDKWYNGEYNGKPGCMDRVNK